MSDPKLDFDEDEIAGKQGDLINDNEQREREDGFEYNEDRYWPLHDGDYDEDEG
jgi:hypothetical protein